MSLLRLRTRLAALERAAPEALPRLFVRWPGEALPADVRPRDLVLMLSYEDAGASGGPGGDSRNVYDLRGHDEDARPPAT